MTRSLREAVPSAGVAGTVLALAALLVAAGCASTGSTEDADSERRDVLTRDQIVSVEVSNLMDVVRRLRPEWLRVQQRSFSGDSRVVVIENGTVIGGVGVLRNYSPDGVEELRFLDGDTAAATLVGSRDGFIEGAIVIER